MDLSQLVTLSKLVEIKNSMLSGNLAKFVLWRIKNRHRYSMLRYEFVYREKYDVESQYYEKYVTYRAEHQLAETYYGPGFNYLFRYSKLGVQSDITS